MKTPSRTKWIPSFITAMRKNEKLCTSFTKIGFIAMRLGEGENERKREREREREREMHTLQGKKNDPFFSHV